MMRFTTAKLWGGKSWRICLSRAKRSLASTWTEKYKGKSENKVLVWTQIEDCTVLLAKVFKKTCSNKFKPMQTFSQRKRYQAKQDLELQPNENESLQRLAFANLRSPSVLACSKRSDSREWREIKSSGIKIFIFLCAVSTNWMPGIGYLGLGY